MSTVYTNSRAGATVRGWGLAFVLLGIFLWLTAPFFATTYYQTSNNQSAALQVLSNGAVNYFGEVKEGFVCALVTVIALVGCMFGFCFEKGYRITLPLSFGSLFIIMRTISEISRLDERIGFGLWGVMAILFSLLILSIIHYMVGSCSASAVPVYLGSNQPVTLMAQSEVETVRLVVDSPSQAEPEPAVPHCPKCQGKLTFSGTYCAACGEFID